MTSQLYGWFAGYIAEVHALVDGAVRLIVDALPALVLHDFDLVVEALLRHGGQQPAHAVGLEPQHAFQRARGHVLEVVGAIEVGGAVQVGGTQGFERLEPIGVVMLGALEHHVLEQVSETGLARLLVLRADVVPHVHGDDGCRVILVQDDRETIGKRELLVGNLGWRDRLRDRGCRQARTRDREPERAYPLRTPHSIHTDSGSFRRARHGAHALHRSAGGRGLFGMLHTRTAAVSPRPRIPATRMPESSRGQRVAATKVLRPRRALYAICNRARYDGAVPSDSGGPRSRDAMTERTISRYRVLEQLGAGGMGEVYKAFDPKMQRDVALKLLTASFVRDADRVQRFEVEALATSALNHPNITTIYEIDQVDGQQFISLEYIAGSSLRELIRGGEFDLRRAIDVAAQIADGLHAAHEAGIVHRDLKPENIMVRHDGIAKILDFGLAKLRTHEAGRGSSQDETVLQGLASPGVDALTRPGMVLGTVAYMSPEQARGQNVDRRSDIFSFGSILYEMLGGKQPFQAESGVEVMHAIIRDPPHPLHELNATVPVELQRIVRKAMAKHPDERYQTARDMAIDLRALELELHSGAVSSVHAPVRARAGVPRRTLRIAALVAGVVVLAGAVAALLATRNGRKPAELAPMRITKITTSGQASSPVLSPNGQFLAHETLVEGRDAIQVRQLATGSEVEVVGPQEGVALTALAFTVDGNWLLYSSRRQTEAMRTLYQVSALGGPPRELMRDLSGPVSFAPDGKRFLFTRVAGPGQSRFLIAKLDATNEIEEVLACPAEALAIANPMWSPKGDAIAYVQIDKADVLRPKLMINTLSGDAPRALTGSQWMQIGGLTWAPDGSGLYITGSRSWIERPRVWFVDASTGAARSLVQDLDSYGGITVRADGKALASVRSTVQAQLYRVPIDGSPAENASRAQQITRGTGLASSPVVSPDGARIAYVSDSSGHMDLWTMDAAGTNPRQLTFGAAQDFAPAWSPDGKQLAFASETEGVLQTWIVDADGKNARQLTRQGTTNHAPSWSPDGSSIAYISVQGDSSFLCRIAAAGGEPVRVSRELEVMYTTQWSPDGRWIATWLDPGKTLGPTGRGVFPPGRRRCPAVHLHAQGSIHHAEPALDTGFQSAHLRDVRTWGAQHRDPEPLERREEADRDLYWGRLHLQPILDARRALDRRPAWQRAVRRRAVRKPTVSPFV